jgi:NhaP-type Na+/H+ or K+/H+ antiporter
VRYGAVAGWLSRRSITMPIVLVGVGPLLGPWASGILPISPRGLASVVFTPLAYRALAQAGREPALLGDVATWTILLSVVAHGLTAQPLAAWYARRLQAASEPLPEPRPRHHVRGHHPSALAGGRAGALG